MIAALFIVHIVQWLLGAVGGLSIPHQARGVKQEADNNPPAAYLTGQEHFGNIFLKEGLRRPGGRGAERIGTRGAPPASIKRSFGPGSDRNPRQIPA